MNALTVCVEIRLLQQLSRWLDSGDLGGEDVGCGGPGLPGGQLDVLSNSLKRFWRLLMVEKWTFSLRATALVDFPAFRMPVWNHAVWENCTFYFINNICFSRTSVVYIDIHYPRFIHIAEGSAKWSAYRKINNVSNLFCPKLFIRSEDIC